MKIKRDIINKLDDFMWDLSNIEDEIQDFKHELEENNYKENEIIYDLEKFKR